MSGVELSSFEVGAVSVFLVDFASSSGRSSSDSELSDELASIDAANVLTLAQLFAARWRWLSRAHFARHILLAV